MNENNNSEFMNFLFARKGKFDFIVTNVSVKADEMIAWLKANKEQAEKNNGFLTFDILKAKSDPNKMYAKFFKPTEGYKKPVTAKEHMPDREKADLPF